MDKTQQVERTDQQPVIPLLPPWPTSRPGPMVTEPPPGQRRILSRPDQVIEVGYNEVQGKSTHREGESKGWYLP